jgi:hypothetical protein
MKKNNLLLSLCFLIFSSLSICQNYDNPFKYLSTFQHHYGKINDTLNKEFGVYDSLIGLCDEKIIITKEILYEKEVYRQLHITLLKKGVKKTKKHIEFDLDNLPKDSLLLKIIAKGEITYFLKNGKVIFAYLQSNKYTITDYNNSSRISSLGPELFGEGYIFQDYCFYDDNVYIFFTSQCTTSFLKFKNNRLANSYYKKDTTCYCPNPFNLQEGYFSYAAYSDEFIQTINKQIEITQSDKSALEEIYRRVKKSNLFKKF